MDDDVSYEVVDRWGKDITVARRFTAIGRLFTMYASRKSFKKPMWPCILFSILFTVIGVVVTGLNCIWVSKLQHILPFSLLSLFTAFFIIWPVIEYCGRKEEFRKTDVELQNDRYS